MQIETDTYIPRVSRRGFLKGLGATLTLPWMESLAHATGVPTGPGFDSPPRRFAAVVFGNGVYPDTWWAKPGSPGGILLSPVLSGLHKFTDDILVLNGLRQDDRLAMRHGYYFTAMLSGGRPERTNIGSATSIDQVIAQNFGNQTIIPSLALGIEPVRGGIVNGAPSVYHASVSWSSPSTPVPVETFPRQAFDRLFDTSRLQADKSILDVVLEAAKSLSRKISRRDREKLDQFSTSIREIEQRIERAAKDERVGSWKPSLDEPNIQRPQDGKPRDIREHMRLMMDLLVLAFQMDRTRVASFVLHQDFSNLTFEFLEGVSKSGVHGISHHQHQQDLIDQYVQINKFHVDQFSYLLERMKSVDEGGSTLLDNSILLFGSSMMDGNVHDVSKVPLILAGRGGGTIDPGRIVEFQNEDQRHLTNLHLAIGKRMGVNMQSFGNSTMPLPQLSA